MIDRTDEELLEALRERTYFMLAEKYSTSPQCIREWPDYDYQRALLYLNAESGDQKFTENDVVKERPMAEKRGFILDLDYSHWKKFVTDGALDAEKLAQGGYSEGQHEYIQEQMASLGWLGEDKSVDTQPLDG